ncbi:AMP-binding enzyme [Nocardia amikacinitolerans]|nr:AMP-binding enzyme [Nocardia amikacinitolerans]
METELRARTLAEAISQRAADAADRIAYTFLPDGENESHSWTFAELEQLTCALAARISREVAPGDRALIVAPDSADFVLAFLACQFAGVVAVPVYPPFPVTSPRRVETLRTIAEDCGAAAVLCAAPEQTRALLVGAAPELDRLRWIGIVADADGAADFEPVPVTGADVSFLQYTSGSTSAPKGVVVTHDALMHNQELLCRTMGYSAESRIVGWLPLFHDMGLMGIVVPAVYAGSRTVLMPPLTFVQRPVRWLRAVRPATGPPLPAVPTSPTSCAAAASPPPIGRASTSARSRSRSTAPSPSARRPSPNSPPNSPGTASIRTATTPATGWPSPRS